MGKYTDILDTLLKTKKEKKKKDPTKEEKRTFHDAWVNLALASGYTEKVERYLFEGFIFCGAEPFFEFLNQTNDQNAALAMMFNGKLYGNDYSVTFRMVTHLLALMLNNNAPQNVLAPVIKRMPNVCMNKENKRLGTATKTIEKYFFSVLDSNASFCPLSDIDTKPVFIKEFVALLSSLMTELENNGTAKGIVATNIMKVKAWFLEYSTPNESENQELETEETSKKVSDADKSELGMKKGMVISEELLGGTDSSSSTSENMPSNMSKSTAESNSTEDIVDLSAENMTDIKKDVPVVTHDDGEVVALEPDTVPVDAITQLSDLLEKVNKAVSNIRTQNEQKDSAVDALTELRNADQEKLQLANEQITTLQNEVLTLTEKISVLESDTGMMSQTITQQKTTISQMSTELETRQNSINILRQKLMSAEGEILGLREELTQKNDTIAKREAEIEARKEMADVLS